MPIEYAGRGDPARTLALLWKTHERPSRGPKPGLSVDQIVAAAIRIADTEGLDALSMRRVATELGVGTMTLYRYVPSKSELLDVMLDTVVGDDPPSRPATLRAALEEIARIAWDHYNRHPWILHVAMARPILGPNTMRAHEADLAILAGFGLSYPECIGALMTIDGFVRGVARGAVESAEAERLTGITEAQWWQEREWFWERLFDPDQYPTLTRFYVAGEMPDEATAPRTIFEFGLARLLDGFDQMPISGKPLPPAYSCPPDEAPAAGDAGDGAPPAPASPTAE